MLEIGIFGATGKVGRLLIDAILENKQTTLASVYVRNELQYNIPSKVLITRDMDAFIESSQTIIDFSNPEATQILLQHAIEKPLPLVIGTTGLSKEQMEFLHACSAKMPILYATNMSEGIAMLNKIIAIVSEKLRDYDVEITDIHHNEKKDAPSGTTLTLANTILQTRNLDEKMLQIGRNGTKLREKDEVGVLSLRGGDIIGRHTVGFYGEGEYLEFTHSATSRTTFANGALHAALWLQKQGNGLYSMQDIFNF